MNDFHMTHLAADHQRDLLAEAQRQRLTHAQADRSGRSLNLPRLPRPRRALRLSLGSLIGRHA